MIESRHDYGTFEPRCRVSVSGDIQYQLDHVVRQVPRLQLMQDCDALSPSHGCFHYAYWRDKTSEFPDARFQEAGAALGLLALPAFDQLRTAELLPSSERMYNAFSSGLHNLARQQYPDGSYDEWYIGERGFAATAFTTLAYALTGLLLGDRCLEDDRKSLGAMLLKAARWLTSRNDFVKINHQIVAAAALATASVFLDDTKHVRAATEKFEKCLLHRNEEGWFVELAGADLGYSFLILDYLSLYFAFSKDARAAEVAGRLLNFLVPHLHPDLTVSPEAGTCRNPYVGQLGFLLFREHCQLAGQIADELDQPPRNNLRTLCYLSDDLRLARWAILPILAALARKQAYVRPAAPVRVGLKALYPQGWTIHPNACLASFHREDFHLFVSAAGGAIVRVYLKNDLLFEDLGYSLREGGEVYGTNFYDAARPVARHGDEIDVSFEFRKLDYFFPGFLKRLLLRAGSTTSATSRLTRAVIDRLRVKKRTAVNQSASAVGARKSGVRLTRTISVKPDSIEICDIIVDGTGSLDSGRLCGAVNHQGVPLDLWRQPFSDVKQVKVLKTIRLSEEGASIEIDTAADGGPAS